MISPINTALSGLAAASTRIAVSADNIANQFSQNYTPKRVDQVSLSPGAIKSLVTDVEPAKIALLSPNNPSANAEGFVEFPNVDIATELVNMKMATYDFKANLNTIKVTDNMQESLLDIFS